MHLPSTELDTHAWTTKADEADKNDLKPRIGVQRSYHAYTGAALPFQLQGGKPCVIRVVSHGKHTAMSGEKVRNSLAFWAAG